MSEDKNLLFSNSGRQEELFDHHSLDCSLCIDVCDCDTLLWELESVYHLGQRSFNFCLEHFSTVYTLGLGGSSSLIHMKDLARAILKTTLFVHL